MSSSKSGLNHPCGWFYFKSNIVKGSYEMQKCYVFQYLDPFLKMYVVGEAFFLLSQQHPPLFCQAAPLNLWTVHKPPPHLFRQFPLPNRGFPKHFDIPLFLCFKLSLQKAKGLFSCWRLEEISRGSPEHCKPPSRSRTEPQWGLRGEVPGSSGYMGFENLLL